MTELLTVDVGNSRTKLGWFTGEALVFTTHFPTGSRAPAEAIAEGGATRASAAAMCSGVPDAVAPWTEALREAIGGDPWVVTGDSDIGIANRYAAPATLGPDRLVAALAARARFGAPVIVVSLGTATVVDAVSPAGEFLGGAIAPGIETSLAALTSRAARLPAVTIERVERAIASDTISAMQAGAFFGAIGQVKELVARVRSELGAAAPVVLTGGGADLLEAALPDIASVEPALTLIGLRLAWEGSAR